MEQRTRRWLGALTVAVLPLAACEDGIGVDGTGTARVTLSGTSGAQTNALAGEALMASTLASVDLSAVDSIRVTITGVDLLPSGEAETEAGGWVHLDVEGGSAVLELLALPDPPGTGVVLATGDVEAGEFTSVRIRFSDATIVFGEEVQVGPATFEAGVAYDLVIPSGAQTGIKTDIDVLIEDGEAETISLIFDEAASTANITATGNGTVIMAPVLRSESNEE